MPSVIFTKSEQDFYESSNKQANEHIQKAQAEAQAMLSKTIVSICDSHDAESPPVPLQSEALRNKKGRVIALLWGQEQQDWRTGALQIPDAVYPPGLPIKAAPNGAVETPKSEAPVQSAGPPSESAPTSTIPESMIKKLPG